MVSSDLSVIADAENAGWYKVEVADDSKTIGVIANTWGNWMFHKAPPEFYGTINSVTVYAKCWRHNSFPGSKAKIRIKTHDTVYEGSEETLTDTATYYSKTWSTNPYTGNAWTMAEVIDAQIGVALYQPQYTQVYTWCDHVYCNVDYNSIGTTTVSILRPNGAGDTTGNNASAGSNYECVDEGSQNGDTDYVYLKASPWFDVYALPTVTVGNILWVAVITVCRSTSVENAWYFDNYIKTHNTTYYHRENDQEHKNWMTFTWFWRLNPNTGSAWTQKEINDLQAGIGLSGYTSYPNRCTQVFVKVCHYKLPSHPRSQIIGF